MNFFIGNFLHLLFFFLEKKETKNQGKTMCSAVFPGQRTRTVLKLNLLF